MCKCNFSCRVSLGICFILLYFWSCRLVLVFVVIVLFCHCENNGLKNEQKSNHLGNLRPSAMGFEFPDNLLPKKHLGGFSLLIIYYLFKSNIQCCKSLHWLWDFTLSVLWYLAKLILLESLTQYLIEVTEQGWDIGLNSFERFNYINSPAATRLKSCSKFTKSGRISAPEPNITRTETIDGDAAAIKLSIVAPAQF